VIELGISKVADTGEYRVYYRLNGVDDEGKAYYTDDRRDAANTLVSILNRLESQGEGAVIAPYRMTYAVLEQEGYGNLLGSRG